ncbi:MAG: TetR/AcrR family transcriptional regulator [Alphaproteobacteria bacterium]|nr:TetR/AcrR family transcriptional regulator [Alphaproteobacteria bacterium]
MPLDRWNRLDPAERRAILDAAAGQFAADGFHGASINRILKEAGLSKGAAYYYFEDKEDLFLTLVRARVGALVDAALGDEPWPAKDFWGWCDRLSMQVFGALMADPQSWALAKELYTMGPGARSPRVAAMWAEVLDWTEQLLTRGQAMGAVRDDLPVSLLAAVGLGVGQALDTWFVTHLGEPAAAPEDAAALMDGSMALFVRLLAPDR